MTPRKRKHTFKTPYSEFAALFGIIVEKNSCIVEKAIVITNLNLDGMFLGEFFGATTCKAMISNTAASISQPREI